MSAYPQEVQRAVRQARGGDAFAIADPLHDPRIAPRVFPMSVAILIGIGIVAILFLRPWSESRESEKETP